MQRPASLLGKCRTCIYLRGLQQQAKNQAHKREVHLLRNLCRFPAHTRANSWQIPELNRISEVYFLVLQGCLLLAGPQVIPGRHAGQSEVDTQH